MCNGPPSTDADRFVTPDPSCIVGEQLALAMAAFAYEGPMRRALAASITALSERFCRDAPDLGILVLQQRQERRDGIGAADLRQRFGNGAPHVGVRIRQRPSQRRNRRLVADAAEYRADTPFDAAVSRFGVMFFADPPVVAGISLPIVLAVSGLIGWIVWHNTLGWVSAVGILLVCAGGILSILLAPDAKHSHGMVPTHGHSHAAEARLSEQAANTTVNSI